MQLSMRRKLLLGFALHQILNILKKKMILIAYVFPKLETETDVAIQMSRKPLFRIPFVRHHLKGSYTLLKSALLY